jgi:hypothetical protein
MFLVAIDGNTPAPIGIDGIGSEVDVPVPVVGIVRQIQEIIVRPKLLHDLFGSCKNSEQAFAR